MSWLPSDFVHPTRVDLGADHHLRPIQESDADRDYPAVMGSRERLWSIFGEQWNWPPATMSYEANRADLARHAQEAEAHESFNYALFDNDETALLGCVYIDPAEDALISWWVVDEYAGTELERALDAFVPEWIARDWPFATPRFGL
ncbi:N-acetyltransferase [Actinosynnema sp. NPDC023587]|uniref:GNAT family N-acetyltransferase n=1 Tax=Actinosynnema sp. NPDC023587 TaxID=3154695 RepID=UPI0033D91C22